MKTNRSRCGQRVDPKRHASPSRSLRSIDHACSSFGALSFRVRRFFLKQTASLLIALMRRFSESIGLDRAGWATSLACMQTGGAASVVAASVHAASVVAKARNTRSHVFVRLVHAPPHFMSSDMVERRRSNKRRGRSKPARNEPIRVQNQHIHGSHRRIAHAVSAVFAVSAV